MTVVSTISGNGNIATNGAVAAASAQITNKSTIGGTLDGIFLANSNQIQLNFFLHNCCSNQ